MIEHNGRLGYIGHMEPTRTVFVLIEDNGRYLLILEGGGRAENLWSLPGGHVNKNESLEQAAVREAKEESGVDIEVAEKVLTKIMKGGEYLGNFEEIDDFFEFNVYKARYLGGQAKPGPTEFDAQWFDKEQIGLLPMRFSIIKELIDS